MKNYFITGTDTNVGKTLVSAILMMFYRAYYWKPIQSGIADALREEKQIQAWTHLPDEKFFPSVYALQASLSPDQAAKRENVSIDLSQCVLPKVNQTLIVEGAGGVLVPLNDKQCLTDLIKQLQIPVIIVARGTLGTINHTLLTIEALRQREIPIEGVVFSGELNLDSKRSIEYWGNVKTLFCVPKLNEINKKTLQNFVEKLNDTIQA